LQREIHRRACGCSPPLRALECLASDPYLLVGYACESAHGRWLDAVRLIVCLTKSPVHCSASLSLPCQAIRAVFAGARVPAANRGLGGRWTAFAARCFGSYVVAPSSDPCLGGVSSKERRAIPSRQWSILHTWKKERHRSASHSHNRKHNLGCRMQCQWPWMQCPCPWVQC